MRKKSQGSQTTVETPLSKREREIMDILLESGELSAEDVRGRMSNPPGNSAVRSILTKLVSRQLIRHRGQNLRYVYSVAAPAELSQGSALSRLVKVFFRGSPAEALAGLLDHSVDKLSDEELDELAKRIDAARQSKDDQP